MWNGNVRVEGKGKERERVENGKEERGKREEVVVGSDQNQIR